MIGRIHKGCRRYLSLEQSLVIGAKKSPGEKVEFGHCFFHA